MENFNPSLDASSKPSTPRRTAIKIGGIVFAAYASVCIWFWMMSSAHAINRFYFPKEQSTESAQFLESLGSILMVISIPIPRLSLAIAEAYSLHLSTLDIALLYLANGALLSYLAARTYLCFREAFGRRK